MCGGGGPSGETKYNWNDTLDPKWQQLLTDATGVAYGNQYQQYGGQRIAGMDPDQESAIHSIEQMTSAGGTPAAIAANNQAQSTLQGSYLKGGANANPYADSVNMYSGANNPWAMNQLRTGLDEMGKAYQQGTAADTTRMFNMGGAFGGSAHQNAMANNEAALGKSMGNMTDQFMNEQYNRSAGLEEQRLGRGMTGFENERARQMQAMGAGQNANNMFFQGTTALTGAGDARRSLTQDQLNMSYQDWLDSQNQDFKNADWLSGIYSKAQGGMAPNSTFNQAGYQASPFSSLVGAGLLYKGMT